MSKKETEEINQVELEKDLVNTVNIDSNLTDEEKEKIDKNKKKEKKKIEVDEDWNKEKELSKEELKQSMEIANEFMAFAKSKAGIEVNSGKIETLPTGIDLLDSILGGGFGVGTMSLIAGLPGTFKSSLVGQVIANSQRKFKGKLLSTYMDSENAMTKKRLYDLGVKNPPVVPYSDITVEKIFKTIEAVTSFKANKDIMEYPSIVVWDSIANTTTEYERNDIETSINSVIGLKARIISLLLPRYIGKLRETNMTLLAINQLRDNISMGPYGSAADLRWMGDKIMPGGNAIKYNAFHLLLLKVKKDLSYDQYGFNGVELEAKCVKNKLFTPNIPIKLLVDFNSGISNFWTNYRFMSDNDIIKGKAWQHLTEYSDMKWQGSKNCKEKYDNDEAFRKAFDEQSERAIKLFIHDKYASDEIPEDIMD